MYAESVTPFLLASIRSALKEEVLCTWFELVLICPESMVQRYASLDAVAAPARTAACRRRVPVLMMGLSSDEG